LTVVVLDASVALALVLEDEGSPVADALVAEVEKGKVGLLAPAHWPLEVLSGLEQAARRRRIGAADRPPAFEAILGLGVGVVPLSEPMTALLSLADLERLRVYDAAYLSLALERRARLATLDAALSAVARRRGIAWYRGAARIR